MASLREVFKKDLILPFIPADPVRETPFWTSGAFSSDGRVNQLISAGSQTFTVPMINDLDAKVEPNYSNTIYTDIAVPRGIDAKSMQGRMAYLNEGFLESRLEKYLQGGVSALPLIAQQISGYWQQEAEQRAIATIIGIRNNDQATGKKITIESATAFDASLFLDAEATMARKYRGRGAIVVHPSVALALRKAQLLIPFTDPANLRTVDTFNGRTVIESLDGTKVGTTVANTQYVSYMLNADAFAAESVAGYDDLELERSASRASGGGTNTLWTRRNMLIHPMGYSFVAAESSLTGGTANEAISASWEDLQKAANWSLITEASKVPFRIIVSK
jgi:hypothetical protein